MVLPTTGSPSPCLDTHNTWLSCPAAQAHTPCRPAHCPRSPRPSAPPAGSPPAWPGPMRAPPAPRTSASHAIRGLCWERKGGGHGGLAPLPQCKQGRSMVCWQSSSRLPHQRRAHLQEVWVRAECGRTSAPRAASFCAAHGKLRRGHSEGHSSLCRRNRLVPHASCM